MKPKILTTMKEYSWQTCAADLFAGITVAMVALPLSLAIAIASGADPAKGIVTAIVGGFFISLLGGSRVQIGGPTGAFIVVVFNVIANHGYDGLVLATLMAGAILLVAGLCRAGSLVRFVPEPVINGFTIGIALIIAVSQLQDMLGLSGLPASPDMIEKIPALWEARAHINVTSVFVAVATIAMIAGFKRLAPKLPGLLVAVGLTSAAAFFYHLPVDTILARFGALPSALPMPSMPEITMSRMGELLPSALVIAFLAGVESLLSAMVADKMTGNKHRSNAEVIAQGVANMASALFAGLPATGAIARTATNIKAGGKTPVAGIVHALSILLMMLLLAPLVGYMAMPALAGLLMLAAWNMSEPHKWGSYLSLPLGDKALLILTLLLTVLTDLTIAIGVGVAIGLAMRLRKHNVPPPKWDARDG